MTVGLEKIGKRYAGPWIFRNLSSTFLPGKSYGVIGHNGSGKSTLLQIIAGFVTPNEGTLLYNEGSTNVESIFKHLSMSAPYMEMPSDFSVTETITNHVRLKPMLDHVEPRFILETIQLDQHKHKSLNELSSGMRQRLNLALAIYTDSSLLILDEPCVNLDKEWGDWFNNTISQTSTNRTVLIGSNSNALELETCQNEPLNVSDFH